MSLHAHPRFEEAGIDPRENLQSYYYTLLKRRWIVVAVALSTWTMATIATFLQPRRYDASALIQIDWGKINLVEDVVIDDRREGSGDLFATQEKILRSRVLARRVSEELRLWEHPAFRAILSDVASGDEESTLKVTSQEVLSMLRVAHFRNTQIMEVGFSTPDPELSARLAETHVRQYVLFNAEAESDLARGASSFIKEEIDELRGEIAEKESLLKSVQANGAAAGDSRDHDLVIQRLEDLSRALTQSEAERAAAEARYRSLLNARPGSLSEVRDTGVVRDRKNKYAGLKEEHRRLSARFGRDWPEVKRSEAALDEAESELEAEMLTEAEKVVSTARIAYQEVVERERLLQSSVEAQRQEVQELQRVRASQAQLEAELDNHREMLQGLLRRRSETDLSADLGERQPVKVRTVEPAEVPERASSPNVPMNLAVGIVLGLLLGTGLAFVLDYFDSTISTVEELRRYVAIPYLGMIPRHQTLLDPGSTPLASEVTTVARAGTSWPTLYGERSPRAESEKVLQERLRFLRGSLLLSTPGRAPKLVLITSPDQSCGKTFVSYHLSAALVQLNKTVLLVDSDLRNPNLHKVFRYRNRVGLTNILTGQKALQDGCIMRTHTPNLFLLMAGPKSPSPSELLASPSMEEVLRSSAQHFDFVVLDSAPLIPVFDSHALSACADAVILVVRSGMTTRHSVKMSVELVERVNGKITGLVLNDVNLSDYAQYYYHSAYSYEYGRNASSGARGAA